MPIFARMLALVAVIVALSAAAPAATDPFLWLERVHGARAQAWVKTENAKTLAVLQRDPHFAGFYANALAVSSSQERIPTPVIIHGQVYDFWQDAKHVRGIWRVTTAADYARPAPAWHTVLDLDALAASEGKNWVWEGADCGSPSGTRCLISLSDGGEDATTIREFDLTTDRFVDGGFVLPRAKQNASWADDDTLLVARAWTPGQVTSSSYPYVVKSLKRGAAFADAVEVARGVPSDVGESVAELQDAQGHRALVAVRSTAFFSNTLTLITPHGPRLLAIPLESVLQALVDDRLVLSLAEPWHVNGRTFAPGSVVAVDLAAATADPQHLAPVLIYAPGPRQALDAIGAAGDKLLITSYDNVRGRAALYAPAGTSAWRRTPIPIPDFASVSPITASDGSALAYLDVTRFLQPTTLLRIDVAHGTATPVKQLRPLFDASHDLVEQREAVSKDGTRIPYFIVHPKALRYDGVNPTLLYAYGGFGESITPYYSGTLGRLWLARGNVYAVANIRGGGEFGPAWHDAGLKTHRQRVYDDFAAVARDLIARKITSPRRLGIQGGSNGGLLMGVEFTQHPELFHAVDIQVPLLDMLRYEKIEAGASWVDEYGSVSVPRERAFLAATSPYDNLHAGVHYPLPFIWTTTKDDRVGPQHARKFAAKLAAMHIPYLFYEVTEGGHGSGANFKERSFTAALEYTYLTRMLT